MSITIADASVTERIQERVDRGEYADADEIIARALNALEVQENIRKVRMLIAEADAGIAEHGTIPWTPTFWDDLEEEARRMDPTAPLPDHLRP